MDTNNIDAFPLCWPQGWPRTNARERGTFSGTPAKVRVELVAEVDRMMGARPGYTYRNSIIISTNVPIRRDGEPFAQEPAFIDPGVAVYFQRKGQRVCFACDKYDKVWKNMRAIAKTIEAMRGIERWGSSDMLDRAFTGFAALPAPGVRNWWEVLGIDRSASPDEIKARYRTLAKLQHPDAGGSSTLMAEINFAYQDALSKVH
jgi:DnaJ domain